MFTPEDLFEVCRRILLESPETYYDDAHYFRTETKEGTVRLSNYLDLFAPGFQQNEPQKAQRLELLRQGRSCLSVNRLYLSGDEGCMIVRPRDLADNFMKHALLDAPGGDLLNHDNMAIFFGGRLISNPSSDPWLVEVYQALKNCL